MLGNAYLATQAFVPAVTSFDAALTHAADSARVYIRRAVAYRLMERLADARADLGHAVSLCGRVVDDSSVVAEARRQLSELDAESRASGTSSIASLAKTVNEPVVVETCTRAIRALDPYAGGAFSIDLKANRSGVPCITEINAGRFITMMNFFDFTGGHNMSAAYIRLAFDEIVDIAVPYDVAEASYLVRGVDMVPTIFSADDLFEGIEDAR